MNVLNPELLISIFWTALIMPGSTEEYWGRQDAAQAIALVESFVSLYLLPCTLFFFVDLQ